VWHDLPNADATLKANLAPLVTLDEREADLLNRSGVNVFVRLQPGLAALRGNVSFAGFTAVNGFWQRLAVSRLRSFILKSLERHTRWVFTAQLVEELPATLERQVWIFFSRLNQRGAFAGAQPEQAFFVRTSGQVLPDADVALTLRVGFAPDQPNEFLVYDFRYHGVTMTTEVVPVLDAERHLG
jgi:phage tail sheath protein FI